MTADKKMNPVTAISKEIKSLHELKELLANEELNEEDILTLAEGETDLTEILLEIEEDIADREADIDAIKTRVEKLTNRKNRMGRTNDTLRAIILTAMRKAELTTIPGPFATLTVKNIPPGLEIDDESIIPSSYWKPQDPKMDKKSIKDSLKAGEEVPGARLGLPGVSLQIRRS